jgi:hypothetical protein
MPILLVSLDAEGPAYRTVELRTPTLSCGVLCEVWIDDHMELCVVDQTLPYLMVRRLPELKTTRANAS